MSDVFTEVDEQVRAERAEQWMRRGWPYALAILVAALAVALAFWGWDAFSRSQESKASVVYSKALEAQGASRTAEAEAGYQKLAKSGTAAYKSMALMQLAGLRQADHKTDEAVALLDRAASAAPDKLTRAAAQLKAGLLLVDTAPLAEVRRRLEPLTAQNQPYRFIAREGLGVARLAAGKTQEARGDFAVLAFSPDLSDAARARARAALSVIDSGTAGAIQAAVKAAAALPPGPAAPPAGGAALAAPTAAPAS